MNQNISDISDTSNMAKRTCNICVTSRVIETKSGIANFVDCPYCPFQACIDCYKRTITDDDSINPPSCMQCKRQFSDDFIRAHFSRSWYDGDFARHNKKISESKEMALLQQTQPHLDRLREMEAIQKEMLETRWEMAKLKAKHEDLRIKLHNLEHRPVEQKTVSVVCACPVDGCRGFISSRHKCGVCETIVCGDCHEVNTEEHKCNPDTVATVNEMKKTCKNCPNCMTAIFKIEGCDQMWCVQCHVAFNWRTGRVEKGVIHNPHFFEYMRRNGGDAPRNPHEVRCGGMPAAHHLGNRRIGMAQIPVTKRYGKSYKSAGVLVTDIYQKVVHIQQTVLPRLPTAIDNETNLDLRIKYMRNEITKEKFSDLIWRRSKDRKKKLEFRDVLDTYCNVMQDLFYRLFENYDVNAFLEAELRVSTFTVESVNRLNDKYQSKLQVMIM